MGSLTLGAIDEAEEMDTVATIDPKVVPYASLMHIPRHSAVPFSMPTSSGMAPVRMVRG